MPSRDRLIRDFVQQMIVLAMEIHYVCVEAGSPLLMVRNVLYHTASVEGFRCRSGNLGEDMTWW